MAFACADWLPAEIWARVFAGDAVAANRARSLSTEMRAMADQEAVVVACQSKTATQKQICDLLALKPAEAQELPFRVQSATRFANVHIFDLLTCVPLACDLFGTAELRARAEKKRLLTEKRASAGERAVEAAAKRRSKLDAWLAQQCVAASTAEWLGSIKASGTAAPALALKFVAETVTAPSFKSVTAEVSAFALRCKQLTTALQGLGLTRRKDSRLCAAFEAGEPIPGFTSVARIAREMAFMRWLHESTDYEERVEERVEELRDEAGHFYPGINNDARDEVKAEMDPPEVWPWLAQKSCGCV